MLEEQLLFPLSYHDFNKILLWLQRRSVKLYTSFSRENIKTELDSIDTATFFLKGTVNLDESNGL